MKNKILISFNLITGLIIFAAAIDHFQKQPAAQGYKPKKKVTMPLPERTSFEQLLEELEPFRDSLSFTKELKKEGVKNPATLQLQKLVYQNGVEVKEAVKTVLANQRLFQKRLMEEKKCDTVYIHDTMPPKYIHDTVKMIPLQRGHIMLRFFRKGKALPTDESAVIWKADTTKQR